MLSTFLEMSERSFIGTEPIPTHRQEEVGSLIPPMLLKSPQTPMTQTLLNSSSQRLSEPNRMLVMFRTFLEPSEEVSLGLSQYLQSIKKRLGVLNPHLPP